eukprot:PhF_6_TR23784/c1_g1_i6/m.33278
MDPLDPDPLHPNPLNPNPLERVSNMRKSSEPRGGHDDLDPKRRLLTLENVCLEKLIDQTEKLKTEIRTLVKEKCKLLQEIRAIEKEHQKSSQQLIEENRNLKEKLEALVNCPLTRKTPFSSVTKDEERFIDILENPEIRSQEPSSVELADKDAQRNVMNNIDDITKKYSLFNQTVTSIRSTSTYTDLVHTFECGNHTHTYSGTPGDLIFTLQDGIEVVVVLKTGKRCEHHFLQVGMAAVAYQHKYNRTTIMAAVGEAYIAPDKETLCITFHGGEITYDTSKRKHWFVLSTNDPPLEMEYVQPPTDVIGSTTSKSSTNDTASSDSNRRKQPSPSLSSQLGGQGNNLERQHEPITQG